MKTTFNLVITLLLFCLFANLLQAASPEYLVSETVNKQCRIKGQVIDRPQSDRLLLLKKGQDFRIDKIEIPIEEGRFSYAFTYDELEMYELIFKDEADQGGWMPLHFFPYPGELEMTLYPEERFEENTIKGGELNEQYAAYRKLNTRLWVFCFSNAAGILAVVDTDNSYPDKDQYNQFLRNLLNMTFADTPGLSLNAQMERLQHEGNYFNENAKEIMQKAESSEEREESEKYWQQFYELQNNNEHLSPEAAELNRKYGLIASLIGDWELVYMEDHVSLTTYSILVDRMNMALNAFPYQMVEGKEGDYIFLFNTLYSREFPDHPYTRQMEQMIETYTSVKVGGKYIDFTATGFDGNEITLSGQIEGQIALIDLWASWCGPCRRHSVSMIPVYEEFKDKGFTIVGVARETDAANAIKAVEKDGYPWLNLVELKDRGGIWHKYGVGNGGGSSFLVDKDGTILAIHPKPEEVRAILSKKLR